VFCQLKSVALRSLWTGAGAFLVLFGAWSISGGGNDYVANVNANTHSNVDSFVSIKLVGCRGGVGNACL